MRAAMLWSLILLAGCSQDDLLSRLAPPEDQDLATKYIELLRARNFDEIASASDPRIQGPNLRDTLDEMADLLPGGAPTSRKLVGAQRHVGPEGTSTNVTFEYGFDGQWVLVNVALLRKEEAVTIVGFNVYPMTSSLEEQSQLQLAGKSLLHYSVLALAVGLPLLTIYAFIVCARTQLTGRKWPWLIFILFGIGTFALNWTTGQWEIQPLSFQLLSASAVASLYGPWVVSVSLPLGAVIFLIRRKLGRGVVTHT
jgi:hypothetical protein